MEDRVILLGIVIGVGLIVILYQIFHHPFNPVGCIGDSLFEHWVESISYLFKKSDSKTIPSVHKDSSLAKLGKKVGAKIVDDPYDSDNPWDWVAENLRREHIENQERIKKYKSLDPNSEEAKKLAFEIETSLTATTSLSSDMIKMGV